MYRKILIAYSGTQESLSAVNECIRLKPDPSTEVHLLTVIDNPSPPIVGDFGRPTRFDATELIAAKKEQVDGALSRRSATLKDAGLNPIIHLEAGEPVDVIQYFVRKLGIELLIVGHARHQSWATRWWRGSTDATLLEKISCALLIASESH
jgi:nucleotide-binding universal stress UspA family protein